MNYFRIISTLGLGVIALCFVYMNRARLDFLFNRTLVAVLAIGIVIIFISGQMWNQIRMPPWQHTDPQTGRTGYFAGDQGYQFVAESWIVAGIYAACVASVVLMLESKRFTRIIRNATSLLGLIILACSFGFVMSIFRRKNQNYPYTFLF